MKKIDERYFVIAKQNGISRSTFRSRIESGWSLKKASTQPVKKPGNWTFQGEQLTDAQMKRLKENKLTRGQINARLMYGWTLAEAVEKKSGEKRDKEEVAVLSEKNNLRRSKERADIAAFAAENGLSYGIVSHYLDCGMSFEQIHDTYAAVYEKKSHRWGRKEEKQ